MCVSFCVGEGIDPLPSKLSVLYFSSRVQLLFQFLHNRRRIFRGCSIRSGWFRDRSQSLHNSHNANRDLPSTRCAPRCPTPTHCLFPNLSGDFLGCSCKSRSCSLSCGVEGVDSPSRCIYCTITSSLFAMSQIAISPRSFPSARASSRLSTISTTSIWISPSCNHVPIRL